MKLNKKQKRTATIASMAALLAVVLGMGGQTFAKYITTQDKADQATVAKWGVVITNTADASFKPNYTNVQSSVYKDGSTSEFRSVVAPGTNGSFSLSINGSPEVTAAVTASLTIDDIYLKNSTGTVNYYPIIWTFNGKSYNGAADGTGTTLSLSQLSTDVATYANKEYSVGTSISTSVSIEWAWAFQGQNDTYDTILGDIAAEVPGAGDGYTNNVTLDVTLNAKVVQVD